MSLSDHQIKRDLVRLNDRLWHENQAIFQCLKQSGYDLDRCVVYELFPDSGSTWIVRLMEQGGALVEIDMDIDDPSSNTASEISTSDYHKKAGQILLGVIRQLHQERNSAL